MKTTMTILATALALLPACGGGKETGRERPSKAAAKPAKVPEAKAAAEAKAEPAKPAVDPKVQKAAEVANAIAEEPENADAILEKHGLDRDQLDAMMFEIAGDPELASAYRLARAESGG